jgi:hypothetical protein
MKITLRSVTAYGFGIPVAVLGVLALFTSALAGGLLLVAGVLALPVVRRRLRDSVGLELSGGATAAFFLVLAVAGAGTLVLSVSDGSDEGSAAPGSSVSDVSVTAESVSPSDARTALSVTWNSRAQTAVDPDTSDMSIYRSNDGEKYLVVRMKITNTGSSEIELTPSLFEFQTNGVRYEYQALFGSGQGLSGATLTPGASYSGWTVFSVPSKATKGSVLVNQEAYYNGNVSVEFSRDQSMPINISSE